MNGTPVYRINKLKLIQRKQSFIEKIPFPDSIPIQQGMNMKEANKLRITDSQNAARRVQLYKGTYGITSLRTELRIK